MKTNGMVGDGTTTATVLAQAMVREGLRAVDAGANPMRVRRGIERTVPVVLQAAAQSRQSRSAVATTSCGSPRWRPATTTRSVRSSPARSSTSVKSGVVTTEESDTLGLSVDVVDGIEFDHGYISGYMVTDPERMEAVLDNPLILLTNKKITAGAGDHADHRGGQARRPSAGGARRGRRRAGAAAARRRQHAQDHAVGGGARARLRAPPGRRTGGSRGRTRRARHRQGHRHRAVRESRGSTWGPAIGSR